MSTFKLLNFNIAHGRGGFSLYQGFSGEKQIRINVAKIGEFLKQVNADVVTLQEVDEDSYWNKHVNLLEVLQEAGGYEFAQLGVTNRREGKKRLLYGNAVLSRFSINKYESERFGTADMGEKGFMYVELAIDGLFMPVINLHLDYRSRRKRILQVEQLIDFLCQRAHPDEVGGPLAPIICGDFNSLSEQARDAVSHLFKFMQGHQEYKLYPQAARTFPALFPTRGLDFVFLPKPYEKIHSEVLKCYLSDHRPVLLNFRWNR